MTDSFTAPFPELPKGEPRDISALRISLNPSKGIQISFHHLRKKNYIWYIALGFMEQTQVLEGPTAAGVHS